MKTVHKLLALGSFFGLAVTAVLAFARLGRPSIGGLLVGVVVLATAAGAPGLVRRRAWPVALVLLPLGAVVLLRTQMTAPAEVQGAGGQVGFYLDQLRAGLQAYARHGFPLDLATAGDLRLLLSLFVYGLVGPAAFFALSLRRPVPAIAILIVPLGFGLTVDRTERVLALPLAFLLLSGCLLLSSRALRRDRWKSGDTAAGLATATAAALLAVLALGATSVAASEPWKDWRTWDIDVGGDTRFLFDSMGGYASLLDPESDAEVMRVRSPVASYWRANALTEFDGASWFSGAAERDQLEARETTHGYTYTVPARDIVPPGQRVRESFEVRSMEADYFFTGGTAETLDFAREIRVHTTGTYALGIDRPIGPTMGYSITAVVPELSPADLVGRGRDYPTEITPRTQLPFTTPATDPALGSEEAWRDAMKGSPIYDEWLGLYGLNQQIVGGATDPYDIALRIERSLRFDYTYSLTPRVVPGQSVYATFLFETKQGFCQHFAGSMATLLRFNGIPARVAVGFATGAQVADDTFVVHRSDAHAWVEAYFPGVGWIAFEPTPGRATPGAGASSTSAGFSDPFAVDVDPGTQVGRARQIDIQRGLRQMDALGPSEAASVAASSATPRHRLSWASAAAVAALLVAWPLGRALLRRRDLRRGDPDRRLRAGLALVRADLADFGFTVPRSWTLEETAESVERRLSLDAGPVVECAQAVLFGGRAATEDDVAAVVAFRHELRRRLWGHVGRRRSLLALYGFGSRREARDARRDASRRARPGAQADTRPVASSA